MKAIQQCPTAHSPPLDSPGALSGTSWQACPAGGAKAGREASPRGPGLPPGGVGREAALTAVGTAGS